MSTPPSVPITRHRLDYLFLPFFVIGILNGLLLSLPESLGVPVTANSWWVPLRSLHSWAVNQEPQHLHIPPTLQASILYDGFVQVPLLIALTIGLVRLKPWVPTIALLYAK